MRETCGFCGGTGGVATPAYDNEGRADAGPETRTCDYCGGSGECNGGDRLLPAPTHEPRATEEEKAGRGLPNWA